MAAGGHQRDINLVNIMKKESDKKHKLKKIIELLKFALTLDDEELLKSTVESVIESLEEEMDK